MTYDQQDDYYEEDQKPKTPAWVWVLVVLGICFAGLILVSIVAAIAIPSLLAAKRSTKEVRAVGCMRAYAEAQVMFHRNDWAGSGTVGVREYAPDYSLLNTQKDGAGNAINLIDAAFAAARGVNGTPKHGYLFQDMQTISGVAINWVDDYGLSGLPATYGRSGYRTFIVATAGTVYGMDQGPSGSFVADYPNNPAAAGWIIAE